MEKTTFVRDLSEGDQVEDLFLVKESRLAETRAGKPYLIVELADRTGTLGGPVWDNAREVSSFCTGGQVVFVSGAVQSYRGKLQLRIETISPFDQSEITLADFVPASPYDIEKMSDEIQKLIDSVEDKWVRKLLLRFFRNQDVWQTFRKAPAAKGMHHAYAGGLLEHCLSMAKIGSLLAAHYPAIDRSLLIAGILLHDIGKIIELQGEDGVIEYTSVGRLKGHLVMGSEMVGEQAARIKDFPEETLHQIQHLILSHHGRLEFGSPTLPMTPEAILLSYIDDLDAKMNLIEHLRRKEGKDKACWSEYQRSMERYLYLTPFEERAEQPEKRGLQGEKDQRQPRLF